MAVSVTNFVCDRDGVLGSGPAGPYPELPDGWTSFNIITPGASPLQGHLCPDCAAAFEAFMNPTGGTAFRKPTREA